MSYSEFSARIYDWTIESLLKGTKQRIARYILQYRLFPVLDVCCGTGKQCYLIGKGKQAIGLDLDAAMIKYATSKYTNIPFICVRRASPSRRSI